jgi:8-oxo-dGTP pyrophosphatase MutT (NUDIX family)
MSTVQRIPGSSNVVTSSVFRSGNAGIVLFKVHRSGDISVLVVREKRNGLWNLPAGKVEPHETSFTGALREFAEETHFCEVCSPVHKRVHSVQDLFSK